MIALFNLIFHDPLYNLLVWFTGIIPGGNVGVAIVLVTVVVKALLLPLQHKFIKTQKKMRDVQGAVTELQQKYKDNREEQARQMLALYKEHGINPFSGFLLILIQLPILIALFTVFRNDIPFHAEKLYSFISLPEISTTIFLGLELVERSLLLAVLVGVTQFIQMKFSIPNLPKKKENPSFQEDFSRSMQTNMKYVMPVVIGFIAIGFPAALSLYWITNNLIMIAHELFVKREAEKEVSSVVA